MVSSTAPDSELGLTEAETTALAGLEQVDDHPLYVMHLYPETGTVPPAPRGDPTAAGEPAWACSLFAAMADPQAGVFGRNFDWNYSPALLLFNHPSDGYASASMVDIEYLGFPEEAAAGLTDKPLAELVGLLDAWQLPFDGLNEAGLVVGMAAVPAGGVAPDPEKETVDSLGIIRLMLDRAATVSQAIDLIHAYNVDFEGQTPLHYLLADAHGDAALVEYHQGEIEVVKAEGPWHHATNFIRSAVTSPDGHCGRYDTITAQLAAGGGFLDSDGALRLLQAVAQPHTQWSAVYGMDTGEIRIVMNQDYGQVHHFRLEMMNR